MHGIVLIERDEDEKQKMYETFRMTKRGISEDIGTLKTWLNKQPHLPHIYGENMDYWLENYLIVCKNSLERTKNSLDIYFSLKTLIPEIFLNRDPLHPEIIKSKESMAVTVMPKKTPSGNRVVVFSHLKESADDYDPIFVFKRVTMITDVFLQEGVDYQGLDIIIDTKNCCFAHISKYSPTLLKNMFDIAMKAIPQSVKRIYIVNPLPLIETAMSLFKQFMSKKLQERIVIYNNISDLAKDIPLNVLPRDYGGLCSSVEEMNDAWQNKIVEYSHWFLHNELMQADESKRVEKCRFASSIEHTFGTQGSFRKMEVD